MSTDHTACVADGPAPWLTCYATHRRQLVAHARQVLGARSDEAEDVVQDVVHRLHRCPPRLRDRSATHAYVRVAVRRGAITRLTRRREMPCDTDALDATAPRRHSQARFEDAVELRAVLGPALAGLSPRQRQVIALVDLGQVPIAEAARRLGISVGTAKKFRHIGLRRLRDDPAVTDLRRAA